jgi:hypothetical protein
MKNFQEKEIKDLATVNGGRDGEVTVRTTIEWRGWFDGSLFDRTAPQRINEFDETTAEVKYKF